MNTQSRQKTREKPTLPCFLFVRTVHGSPCTKHVHIHTYICTWFAVDLGQRTTMNPTEESKSSVRRRAFIRLSCCPILSRNACRTTMHIMRACMHTRERRCVRVSTHRANYEARQFRGLGRRFLRNRLLRDGLDMCVLTKLRSQTEASRLSSLVARAVLWQSHHVTPRCVLASIAMRIVSMMFHRGHF